VARRGADSDRTVPTRARDLTMAGQADPEELRLVVYRTFATEGRPPTLDELVRATGTTEAAAREGLRTLARARHLVLDGEDGILMAHPFSAMPLGFAVMGERRLWWGGCAWDSFAIPCLVATDPEVLIASRCPGCGRALAWTVSRDGPPAGAEVAHFLVPARRMWDDVLHTCGNQRLFCDEACVDAWLARTGHERGYVMGLETLWRLARGWYSGRLDHGYRRREPSAAADYFRAAGLHGPFWGLTESTT
jgi:hypothetical protein